VCDVQFRPTPIIDEWNAVTIDKIEKLIISDPCKYCQLDPVPTWLVKMCGLLSPFVALLCNKSLTTGCFPIAFKSAIIRPLLKKNGVDSSQLKNYCLCPSSPSYPSYWREYGSACSTACIH